MHRLVPNDVDETIGTLHTYEDWQVVLKTIEAAVHDKGGKTSINLANHSIDCTLGGLYFFDKYICNRN